MRTPQTAKSTIKNDPFAAVIPLPTDGSELPGTDKAPEPQQPVTPPEPPPPAVNTDRPRTEAVPAKRGKQKLTVHLPAELAERVKNAAYWNPRLTIGGIAEQGIKSAIEKHEREHGGKYPPREGALTGGRPIK
jgi:hypothetical protein